MTVRLPLKGLGWNTLGLCIRHLMKAGEKKEWYLIRRRNK